MSHFYEERFPTKEELDDDKRYPAALFWIVVVVGLWLWLNSGSSGGGVEAGNCFGVPYGC